MTRNAIISISPLLLFVILYLVLSVIVGDFYKVPITVAFMITSIYSVAITKGEKIDERIKLFSKGAANYNMMLMVWIFILAGAFASLAKGIGAIEETVNLSLFLLPDKMLFAGIFLASCLISLSIGTSVGTVVALTPLAVGIAEETSTQLPLMVAIVVGGSFFGDNLSFISDTTISATRTQGCNLSDKFKVNFRIVMPAAIITLILYSVIGNDVVVPHNVFSVNRLKILPYLFVLITAIIGMNVLLVLVMGIFLCCIVSYITATHDIFDCMQLMGKGIESMGELIIVTMLAGGIMEMIRYNGGIDYVLKLFTNRIRTKRMAELSIAVLVSLINLCTANNTVAIITAGPLANDIANKYGVDKRKSASILDTFSCLTQSVIPYGAQLLMASGLAIINPVEIIPYLYYPFVMGIFAVMSIIFRYPRKYS